MINSELGHDLLLENTKPKLSYAFKKDFNGWKGQVRNKFIELTGLDEIEKNDCPLNFQIKSRETKNGYQLIAFTFDSEVGETVPCYLCIPDNISGKRPVAITLQGHSTGFHNSIGEIRYKQDEDYQPRGSFALQAVENGYIALAIEQRGMGVRMTNKPNRLPNCMCQYASRVALGLGRTIIGERVWDIHKAIDVLERYFPECDSDKIIITGNSGGGTTSYYATCYDDRIKICAPSCSFCSYKESILNIAHCACNYIPFMYKYFDMQDLACMIAPRNLIVIAGKEDDIFPIEGVRKGFKTISEIYKDSLSESNCKLIETPKGHWWCEDIVWPAINEECKKLGWK